MRYGQSEDPEFASVRTHSFGYNADLEEWRQSGLNIRLSRHQQFTGNNLFSQGIWRLDLRRQTEPLKSVKSSPRIIV
jgi:hypothetical protein